MGSVYGKHIKYTLFGESHGKAIGISIDGLPSGVKIDEDMINREMDRRRPGQNAWSTPRKEADKFEILSGVFEGRTTGTPLCAVIRNTDKRSKDYGKMKSTFRPSHADYTGYKRYEGFNDYRGGGHFSGRLTAPIVFAGAVAKQILSLSGVEILGHISQIGNVLDDSFLQFENKRPIGEQFLLLNESKAEAMKREIEEARLEQDSIGGKVEIAILNLKAGVGDPFFDTLESQLASGLFAVPAVKGVSFGRGFELASMRGSEANDEMIMEDGIVRTTRNNNGGIVGGISNGMPIVLEVAIKPTPSIGKIQNTIDLEGNAVKLEIEGRHDPCIVPRAVPVVEAVCAMTILDAMR